MSTIAASREDPHSAFRPVDDRTPEGARTATILHSLLHRTIDRSVKMWNKLSRRARILLVALLMTTSSFGLSMIVAALAR